MTDLPGRAIHESYFKNSRKKLFVHDQFGPKVEMPLPLFFRSVTEMPELERTALHMCKGKVLDIGAGAGSHSLELQERNVDVAALEISPAACEVITARGVRNVVCEDIFKFKNERYDTLLLLMNGIGLCGTCDGFQAFLQHAGTLLRPGGQLIFDSCDVAYMYEELPRPDHYYGEVQCRYQYAGEETDWFRWLYLDYNTMSGIAADGGWKAELMAEDGDQYLVRLFRRSR